MAVDEEVRQRVVLLSARGGCLYDDGLLSVKAVASAVSLVVVIAG
jgi:hypothetical protein